MALHSFFIRQENPAHVCAGAAGGTDGDPAPWWFKAKTAMFAL
jgi:hypothetical protein